MPPPTREETNGLGWKLFFGLLMLMQIIATGVMWRTYDAVQQTTQRSQLTEYKVDHVLTPRIERLEARRSVSTNP